MTGEDLLDSMEYLDGGLVEMAESPHPKRKRYRPLIGAVAACLVICIGVSLILPHRVLWFTPQQIADLMTGEGESAGGVPAYGMIELRSGYDLSLMPIPDAAYIPVYLKNKTKLPKNEMLMQAWLDPILKRMEKSLGEEAFESYDIGTNRGFYNQFYSFVIERSRKQQYTYDNCEFWLDGELVTVDPNQSDEEILDSLESVKQKLFAICGAEFSDAKVVRTYHDFSSDDGITIIYYDASAHPLNPYLLISDFIAITVDRSSYKGWWSSADERVSTKISYRKHILSPDTLYKHSGNVKRISLEEAEEMLRKGYVFYPGCEACMAMQPDVDFSDYDHVSFEYLTDAESGSDWVLPFYAFYKKIREDADGTITYAKTYVCAMEVFGLEAFFEMQGLLTEH